MATSNSPSFARLIEAVRAGDDEATTRLLEGYRNYLRFLARDQIFTTLRAKLDASDVAQEVLIDAREAVGRFAGRTERELLAWLRSILTRRLVDFARKHHTPGGRAVVHERSLQECLDESSHALGKLAAPAVSPSRHAAQRELSSVVAEALAKLPRDQEDVVRLRSIQGLGWDEVARLMGRSNDAARQLWVRALRRLRPLVENLR